MVVPEHRFETGGLHGSNELPELARPRTRSVRNGHARSAMAAHLRPRPASTPLAHPLARHRQHDVAMVVSTSTKCAGSGGRVQLAYARRIVRADRGAAPAHLSQSEVRPGDTMSKLSRAGEFNVSNNASTEPVLPSMSAARTATKPLISMPSSPTPHVTFADTGTSHG